MTSFSAPQSYSITSSDTVTLNDTITIDTSAWANISAAVGSADTITISNGGYSIGAAGSTFTYSSGAGSTVGGITSIGTSDTFKWAPPEEFVNCLPEFERIQKMCEQYPGLKIAYEKFKTTYKLVRDHYDTPEDQRPRT
jgi:hypothetical protein